MPLRLSVGLLLAHALACIDDPVQDATRCATDADCPSFEESGSGQCMLHRRICGPLGACIEPSDPVHCDPECERAADCPGNLPACDSPRCPCRGSFKVCQLGRCGEVIVDCFGEPDAGEPESPFTLDGGAPCLHPADCSGTPESVGSCASTGAAWSCLDGHCLWECPGERSCESTDGGPACLGCAGGVDAGAACPPASCPSSLRELTVEEMTCARSGFFNEGERFTSETGPDCVSLLRNSRGGFELGRLWPTGTGFLADSVPLGGRCTGSWLPTGAPRFILACPNCQVVFLGEP